MRQVAVTEGDKVAAEMKFGFATNGYGVGDLAAGGERRLGRQCQGSGQRIRRALRGRARTAQGRRPARIRCLYGARLELGLRAFLEEGGFKGFTTTFEDLHGLRQLPGLAPQRLMAEGYGFGGEGDWKTAALVRAMKVMGEGLKGGTSFMEDYTYHLAPGRTSGSRRAHARDLPDDRRGQAQRSKFIRFRSAARRIRSGSCSTRRRAPRSTRG